jgi:hypothetical protein
MVDALCRTVEYSFDVVMFLEVSWIYYEKKYNKVQVCSLDTYEPDGLYRK